MKKQRTQQTQLLILATVIFLSLLSCKPTDVPIEDGSVCTHPWIVVGFDAESIGTTTGEVDTWTLEDFGSINKIVRLPIGLDSFDKILENNYFAMMLQMYSTNDYPEWLFPEYGVYPMNVFAIDIDGGGAGFYSPNFHTTMEELKEDDNVLYVSHITCTKSYCREDFSTYREKGE